VKYIKSFEKKVNKTFWLVKTKMPYFEIALKKLGLREDWQQWFLNNDHIKKSKLSKIFIPLSFDNPTAYYNASNKYYNQYTKSLEIRNFFESSKKDLEDQGFNYMGEVKITKQDLLDWEINDKAKKYNIL
jgi:hypothetical protein